jgi:acyl-coenzyme A thioesterase PaaI-like protein
MLTPDYFNKRGSDNLPGHLGIIITHVSTSEVRSELQVKPALMAPNGFLHAGSIVTLADTSAGYGLSPTYR